MTFQLEKVVQMSIPSSTDSNYPEANATKVSGENVAAGNEKFVDHNSEPHITCTIVPSTVDIVFV